MKVATLSRYYVHSCRLRGASNTSFVAPPEVVVPQIVIPKDKVMLHQEKSYTTPSPSVIQAVQTKAPLIVVDDADSSLNNWLTGVLTEGLHTHELTDAQYAQGVYCSLSLYIYMVYR